ncbi:MAG: hypothetical protein AAGA72_08240 [Pseudomonadota bacterium]
MEKKSVLYPSVTSNVSRDLKDFLTEAAKRNKRTLSAEISDRLEFTKAVMPEGETEKVLQELSEIPGELIANLKGVANINGNSVIAEIVSRLSFTMKWAAHSDINAYSRAMETLSPDIYARLVIANEQARRINSNEYKSAQFSQISSVQPLGERDQGRHDPHLSNPINSFLAAVPLPVFKLQSALKAQVNSLKYGSHFDFSESTTEMLDSLLRRIADITQVEQKLEVIDDLCDAWESRRREEGNKVKQSQSAYRLVHDGEALSNLARLYSDYIVYEWHEMCGFQAVEILRSEGLNAGSVLSNELKPKVIGLVDTIDEKTQELIQKVRPLHDRALKINQEVLQIHNAFINED